jgi:hypothetical protein
MREPFGDTPGDLEVLRERVGRFGLAGTVMGTIALTFHLPYLGANLMTLACVGFHLLGVLVTVVVWRAAPRATSRSSSA